MDEPEGSGDVTGGIHCKKRFAIFPSPAGMSLTKLSVSDIKCKVKGAGFID